MPSSKNNYTNIASAISDLNNGQRSDGGSANGVGVSAAVVFEIADGTYKELLVLKAIKGASATNTITFTSASHDSSKVLITWDQQMSSYPSKAIWQVNGASYIHINHLGIQEVELGWWGWDIQFNLQFTNGCSHNVVNNNFFAGDIWDSHVAFDHSGSSLPNNENIVTHNYMHNGAVGVYFGAESGNDYGNSVVENIFINVPGISVGGQNHFIFSHNYFNSYSNQRGGEMATPAEFAFISCSDIEISFNKIHYYELTKRLLYFYNCGSSGAVNTFNNEISFNRVLYFSNMVEIDICNRLNLYYNTFSDSSSDSAGVALRITGDKTFAKGVNFENNNIYANGMIGFDIDKTLLDSMDYNNYYTPQKKYYNILSKTIASSISDWQFASKLDAHSLSIDPQFIKGGYRPNTYRLQAALPLKAIDVDITGLNRDAAKPTIGAYESGIMSFDTTICKTGCADLVSRVKGMSYTWSVKGETGKSVHYCPGHEDSITLFVKTGADSADMVMITYHIHVTSYSCVWPGDANADGNADIFDLLNIGLSYGDTGSKRINANTAWTGQPCPDWHASFASGVNYKHADFDGNGIVDIYDLKVLATNYGSVHTKNGGTSPASAGDPSLSFHFMKDSVKTFDTASVFISLDDKVNSAYGIAFSLHYPDKYVKTAEVTTQNSWLGVPGKDVLHLEHQNGSSGTIDIGLVRNNKQNRSGSGTICKVTLTFQSGGDLDISKGRMLNMYPDEIRMISNKGIVLPVNSAADSILLYGNLSEVESDRTTAGNFMIFPNPASSVLYLNADFNISKVAVMNAVGQVVYTADKYVGKQADIDINALPHGLYFITVHSVNSCSTARFLKE